MTAIASLLPDELSWQLSELSGRLARQPTDWRTAITVSGVGSVQWLVLCRLPTLTRLIV
ncbi:hypothetical protein [Ferrovum myxofaciens]|uniref:hypothetical protein n=1 Tax=Ferrovum myxofaciens TaxID=416213 RepID=UPI0013621474|nr:hypothetical protein [Ferrovum myxofaciens]